MPTLFGPLKVTLLDTSCSESALQMVCVAGVMLMKPADPRLPVLPVTVIVRIPPMPGGLGPDSTAVTLLAAA